MGKTAIRGNDFEGGATVSEDETRRDRLATEGDEGKEDVEAHRHHPATEEEDSDDVEAHRQHGGSGKQHGGA